MRGKFGLAAFVLCVVALAWNAFVHLVVLRAADASVRHLWRSDLGGTMWLSLLLTAGVVVLFTWGYSRFARDGSLREGLVYGVFFALVAGFLVDLNQYVLYPIPARVALSWFAAGVLEFSLYGALLTRLLPPAGRA
jgi:hypothetical protein